MNNIIVPIILAAGKSGRFGSDNKLLFKIQEISIIERTLRTYLGVFEKITIVLGYDSENIKKLVSSIQKFRSEIIFLENNSWKSGGMSSSIKIGLQYIKENVSSSGILIHPGDMPYVSQNDINLLISKIEKSNDEKIIIPQHSGKNGHPTFFSNIYFDEILKIDEYSLGLKSILSKFKSKIENVECSSGVLKDIDVRDDLPTANN